MTDETRMLMTCDEFAPLVQDYLEHDVDWRTRERMDAHRLNCRTCDKLVDDLLEIAENASHLGDLAPSRDLWAGIESRIETEVVVFPTPVDGVPAATVSAVVESPAAFVAPVSPLAATPTRRVAPWKMLAAASALIAVTATVTWQVAVRAPDASLAQQPDTGFAAAMANTRNTRLASSPTLDQTYDGEIAQLRKIVDERRADLDSATVAVLEKNLAIIDQAIAESKAALAQNPSSAFLLERLTDAYDSKLRVLRAVAAIPQRG
jgi:hypothetical protein